MNGGNSDGNNGSGVLVMVMVVMMVIQKLDVKTRFRPFYLNRRTHIPETHIVSNSRKRVSIFCWYRVYCST